MRRRPAECRLKGKKNPAHGAVGNGLVNPS